MFELQGVSICGKLPSEVLLRKLQQAETHLNLWTLLRSYNHGLIKVYRRTRNPQFNLSNPEANLLASKCLEQHDLMPHTVSVLLQRAGVFLSIPH